MKIKMFFIVCLVLALLLSPTARSLAAPAQASIPVNLVFRNVVSSGLTQPLFATHAGDGSGRLFILQRGGQILIWNGTTLNPTPFLDVSSIIKTDGGEQGLLGLAFDPNYASNGYFYIVYTDQSTVGDDVLARYKVSNGNANVANPASAQILLTVPQPDSNHNGGMIAFGPDGYLYFGLGDGGGGGDPGNYAQNKNTLLGKILRLDVSTVPYTIPPSNPFYNQSNVKKEIWAYGLRNPWRFSFDKSTGDLYIGDVGQNAQEEIDLQGASATGGANYGWRVREGTLCYNPSSNCVSPAGYVAPLAVYNHGVDDAIGCSVTGGYIYRGTSFAGLVGVYLYGDFCTGKVWGLYKNASNQWTNKLIASTNYNISSFAQDEQGELYILNYGGDLIHITQSPIVTARFTSNAAQDGHVVETSETSGVGGLMNASYTTLTVGDTGADQQMRAILSFDTRSLPDNAIITYDQIKIKKLGLTGGDPFTSLGPLLADLATPAFSNDATLQSVDFQAAPTYAGCIAFSNAPVANWYTAALKPACYSNINLGGYTQFRLRFTNDDNDNLSNDRVNFLSGNSTVDKPELTVNYYLP